MKTLLSYTLILLSSLLILGCKDVFEEDISKRTPVIKSPTDGISSDIYAQTFWWEEMKGASKYKIEIASPSFDQSQKIILDTTVTTTKFTKTLNPGSYQWRVRGENGSYQSKFQTYSLTITTASLTKQTVKLLSPENGKQFSTATFTFTWETVFGATEYEIEIDSLTGSGVPVKSATVSTPEFSYTFTKEGDYKWRVRAKDATEYTPWASNWSLSYYTTPPPAPAILYDPPNKSSTTLPVFLSWSPVSRAKSYKLYLFKASVSTPEIFDITGTSKQLVSLTLGTNYSWKVSTVDKAGTEGQASTISTFTTAP